MRKAAIALVAPLTFLVVSFTATTAQAEPAETCPDGDGWTKFDVNGLVAEFPAPEDGFVLEVCVKGQADQGLFFFTLEEGDLTVDSPFFNDNDQQQEISHASYRYVADEEEEEEEEEQEEEEQEEENDDTSGGEKDKDVAGEQVADPAKTAPAAAPALPNTGAPNSALAWLGALFATAGAILIRRGRTA